MVNKISHYMTPEKVTELYKEEAISSIALARDMGKKLNEVIDLVNEFQSQRDNKYQEQDGKIQKAIIYLKHNLKNTMLDLINIMKNNGELSETITNAVFEEFEKIKDTTADIVRPEHFGAVGNRNY